MTDSIKTSLSLSKLSPLVRKDIYAKLCTVCTPWGEVTERYSKPSFQQSAMTETKTQWVVWCESDPDLGPVPSQIDADLNIPNATVGHNLVHGCSVYAAGKAALGLQRIWMAASGLPGHELDLLTTADVSLRGVTLTYLHLCASKVEAENLVESIYQTARVLHPNQCELRSSTNDTVIIRRGTYTIKVYIKTNLKHCAFPEGAPVAELVEQALRTVRIEVVVGLRFLKSLDRVELDQWRDAYARGVYEQIYNATVRKTLRLDDGLRHRAPREEVYDRLTPTEAQLLRGYIDGRDPRKFGSVVESRSPAKRYSALHRQILKKAKVDISIPWADHVKLRCFELADPLHYPGDCHPEGAAAPWCFCQGNWRKAQDGLGEKYEAALVSAHERACAVAV